MKLNFNKTNVFGAIILFIALSCTKNDDNSTPEPEKTISSIAIDASNLELTIGDSITLAVKHIPANLPTPNYSWSSSDPTVAAVVNGKVKGLKVGEATIKTEISSNNLKSEIKVKVMPVTANGLTLNSEKNTLSIGEKTTITYQILPLNTTNKESILIEWSSDKNNIATVNNGEVTAVAIGTAEITAKIKDSNISSKFNITVKAVDVASVTLNQQSGSISIGAQVTLQATVLPSNATNKNVSWSSSNTSVATVSNTGVVTGITAGTADIVVKTEDGNKTATYKVTVTPVSVTSITLPSSSGTINIGSTYNLTPTVLPTNASNKNIIYSSSDQTVATVSSTGTITAIKEGTAIITVKTIDGNKTATYTATVPAIQVESIAMSINNDNMEIGQTSQATFVILPQNASNRTVTWSSSNTAVATVNASGLITAISAGSTTITVRTANGKTASRVVQVRPISITSISLNKTRLDIIANERVTLTATITPSNAYASSLFWESTVPTVATVDQQGNVTSINYGTTTIRVRASQGSSIYKECVVSVQRPENTFVLEQTKGTIETVSGGGTIITHLVTKVRVNNKSSADIAYVKYEVIDKNGNNKGSDNTSRSIAAGTYTELDFKLINWTTTTTMYVTVRYKGVDYQLPIELKRGN